MSFGQAFEEQRDERVAAAEGPAQVHLTSTAVRVLPAATGKPGRLLGGRSPKGASGSGSEATEDEGEGGRVEAQMDVLARDFAPARGVGDHVIAGAAPNRR